MSAHIQGESHTSISDQNQYPNPVKIIERFQPFDKGQDTQIDNGADRRIVMQGYDRVHLRLRQLSSLIKAFALAHL